MTTEATERDLVTEVEELLAKATPSPWNYSRGARCYHVASADGTFETACIMFAGGKGTSEGNAALIAAAPELLRRLVEENKQLREQLAELVNVWRHADGCEWWLPRKVCTCGLADIVEKIK